MKGTKHVRRAAGLLIALIMTAACGASPAATSPTPIAPASAAATATATATAAAKPETPNFVIAGVPDPQFGSALQIANELGYFKDEGLSPTLTIFPTGAAQKEAIVTNRAQIGLFSDFVWATIVAAGEKVSIVAQASELGDTIALVTSDRVKTPKDLEGKKVGVIKASILEAMFLSFADRYGVDAKKVEILNMQQPDMVAAIANRQIDGAVVSGPVGPQAVDAGKSVGARIIHTCNTSFLSASPQPAKLNNARTFYEVRNDFLSKNPNTVAAFLRAVRRASNYISASKDAAADVISRVNTGLTKPVILDTWSKSSYHLEISDEVVKGIQQNQAFQVKAGALSSAFDIPAYIDTTALKTVDPKLVTWTR